MKRGPLDTEAHAQGGHVKTEDGGSAATSQGLLASPGPPVHAPQTQKRQGRPLLWGHIQAGD